MGGIRFAAHRGKKSQNLTLFDTKRVTVYVKTVTLLILSQIRTLVQTYLLTNDIIRKNQIYRGNPVEYRIKKQKNRNDHYKTI